MYYGGFCLISFANVYNINSIKFVHYYAYYKVRLNLPTVDVAYRTSIRLHFDGN